MKADSQRHWMVTRSVTSKMSPIRTQTKTTPANPKTEPSPTSHLQNESDLDSDEDDPSNSESGADAVKNGAGAAAGSLAGHVLVNLKKRAGGARSELEA